MIANNQQLQTTLERIACFRNQVTHPAQDIGQSDKLSRSGFWLTLAEIDRTQLEVREYLSFLPAENERAA